MSGPATDAQLRAALKVVLVVERDRAIEEQRKAHRMLMITRSLSTRWQKKLEEALPSLESPALDNILSPARLDVWVSQTLADLKDVQHGITGDAATSPDLPNPTNELHAYLWNFGQYVASWKDAKPAAFAAWTAKFEAALNKVADLQTVAENQLASLRKELNSYVSRWKAVRDKVNAIKADPKLAVVQELITGVITKSVLDPARMVVEETVPEKALAPFLAMPLAAIDRNALNNGLADAVSMVYQSQMFFNDNAVPRTDYLAAVLSTSDGKYGMKLLMEKFGASACFALAPMLPSDVALFFGLYRGSSKAATFQAALSTLLPAKCDVESLGVCIRAALKACTAKTPGTISDADRANALKAIQDMPAFPEVSLPPAIQTTYGTPFSVNGYRFPGAFSTSQVMTDEACIKHVAQETGTKPTKEKLNMYLAEMVAACEAAKTAWVAAGKPPATYIKVQNAGWKAHWNLRLQQTNEKPYALVYHIDSGYEQSPWVKFSP